MLRDENAIDCVEADVNQPVVAEIYRKKCVGTAPGIPVGSNTKGLYSTVRSRSDDGYLIVVDERSPQSFLVAGFQKVALVTDLFQCPPRPFNTKYRFSRSLW